ncbi:hypothetical protein BJ912DRAFT_1070078 [Pholiota molesta]|nr:hypothetical protein BJ912DRAFT_1070078 [Pholiota molesta]
MSMPSIHPFNPLQTFHGGNLEWHSKLQEVIHYGESRFRCALSRIVVATSRQQQWMQEYLHKELLFIMSYVGLATSIGLVVDVPFVVRSLGDSLGMLNEPSLPLVVEVGFIDTLAAGTNSEQFGRVVESYVSEWWAEDKKPAESTILGPRTVNSHLDHYRNALAEQTDSKGNQLPALTVNPIPAVGLPSASPSTSCPTCEPHRALATTLLAKLNTLKNLTSALVLSHKAHTEVDTRKALASFLLYEQVVRKEADTVIPMEVPAMTAPTETARASRAIRAMARDELNHLYFTESPSPHYKWTSGEILTREEVLHMARRDHVAGDSGYNVSLADERAPMGDDSSTNSPGDNTGATEPVSPTITRPPPGTNYTLPALFNHQQDWKPILEYDALQYKDAPPPLTPSDPDVHMSDPPAPSNALTTGDIHGMGFTSVPSSTKPRAWGRLRVADVAFPALEAPPQHMLPGLAEPHVEPVIEPTERAERWLEMFGGPSDNADHVSPAIEPMERAERWLETFGGPSDNADHVSPAIEPTERAERWLETFGGPSDNADHVSPAIEPTERAEQWLEMFGGPSKSPEHVSPAIQPKERANQWLEMCGVPSQSPEPSVSPAIHPAQRADEWLQMFGDQPSVLPTDLAERSLQMFGNASEHQAPNMSPVIQPSTKVASDVLAHRGQEGASDLESDEDYEEEASDDDEPSNGNGLVDEGTDTDDDTESEEEAVSLSRPITPGRITLSRPVVEADFDFLDHAVFEEPDYDSDVGAHGMLTQSEGEENMESE